MIITIKDYEKNETRKADTHGLAMLQWVKVNFGGWGFYRIEKSATNHFTIHDVFAKSIAYEVCK